MRIALLPALAALVACGGPRAKTPPLSRYAPADPAPERPVVAVWVDDDPDLPMESMKAGCEIWKLEGARCEFVGRGEPARVRVWPYHGPCKKNDRGSYTLATAYSDGKIIFNVECFKRGDDKTLDRQELAVVMAHEMGHQFGIWKHVHADCGQEGVRTHPDGTPLCGVALMNPMRRRDVFFLTPLDHLAFEMRDRAWSVLTADAPDADVPTCVYDAPAH